MPYSAPTITSAGLTIPSYNDILNDLLNQFRNIYGASVYLANDSADYQLISAFSLKTYDVMLALQLVYNNRAPNTAIGAALSSVVKYNGLARKQAGFSSCAVILTGVAGTLVPAGLVQDLSGNLWAITPTTTIGSGITQFSVANGGNGYLVGDVIVPTQGGSAGGSFTVTSVGGGGNVTGLQLTTLGTGFHVANGLATTGGTGTSLTVNILGIGSQVTATCQTIGAVTALPHNLNKIASPQAGWTSVDNLVAATVGQAIETDSQLRARQDISVELPSITLLAGTIAAIAGVSGVTRQNTFENPTGGVDAFGTPAHSLTCVVEGGTDAAVAQVIYNNRGIGPLTNGFSPLSGTGVTVNVVDPSNGGIVMPISFYRPADILIYVKLNVHPLLNYTSATTAAIQAAVAAYLNSLAIGELVSISALTATAMSVNANLSNPNFSVRGTFADVTPAPVVSNDIPLLFYQVAQGIVGDVNVVIV